MSFFKSIGAAWQSLQDTVAPPPDAKTNSVEPAPENPYAALYDRHLAAEGGYTAASTAQGEPNGGMQSTAHSQSTVSNHQPGPSPPVAFFTPGCTPATTGSARRSKAPSSRYVPVDDGFGSTAGHAERGAKYGNHATSMQCPPNADASAEPPVNTPPMQQQQQPGHAPHGAVGVPPMQQQQQQQQQ